MVFPQSPRGVAPVGASEFFEDDLWPCFWPVICYIAIENGHLVGGLEHLDYFSIYWEE